MMTRFIQLAALAASALPFSAPGADFVWNNPVVANSGTLWSAGTWSNAGAYPKSASDNIATPSLYGRLDLDASYTVGNFTFGTAAAPVTATWQVVAQNVPMTPLRQLEITGALSVGPATSNQLLFRNTTSGTLALKVGSIDSSGQLFFGQNETAPLVNLQVTGLTNITGGQVVVTSKNATFGEVRLTQGDPAAATAAFRVDNFRNFVNGVSPDATVTIAGLSGTGGQVQGANAMNGAATGTLNIATAAATSYTYGGTFIDGIGVGTNRLALVKSGAGTQTLGAASPLFTGGTTVQAGTLLVTNSTGSGVGVGAVSVASGATLGGGGRIALGGTNTIAVASGGAIAPGAGAAGTLTLDGASTSGPVLNMAANSTFHFTLGVGNASGRVAFVNYAGASDFVLGGVGVDLANAQAGTYTLFQFFSDDGTTLTPSGITSGFDSSKFTGIAGYNASLAYNNSDITLTLSPAPEPGAAVCVLVLGAALLVAHRRVFAV